MVCATPRVEPGFWPGDNIAEAQPRQPARQAPHMGSSIFLPRAFLWEVKTDTVRSEQRCAQEHKPGRQPGQGGVRRALTAFLSPFRSGVFNMRASNTSSVSLRTYSSTEKQRGAFSEPGDTSGDGRILKNTIFNIKLIFCKKGTSWPRILYPGGKHSAALRVPRTCSDCADLGGVNPSSPT